MDERIEELRRRLEALEQVLGGLRRDDDRALSGLAQELERQVAQARSELAALGASVA